MSKRGGAGNDRWSARVVLMSEIRRSPKDLESGGGTSAGVVRSFDERVCMVFTRDVKLSVKVKRASDKCG